MTDIEKSLYSQVCNLKQKIQKMSEDSWTKCIDEMPPLYKINLPYLFKVSDKYTEHYELAYADDEDFFNKHGIKNLEWKPVELTQVTED